MVLTAPYPVAMKTTSYPLNDRAKQTTNEVSIRPLPQPLTPIQLAEHYGFERHGQITSCHLHL